MIVLKLDFQKTFDTVSWDALQKFFVARGFEQRWTKWISTIFNSSSAQIMMNGHLREKIMSKCSLRQGDALSPHLFILVANVLQQLCEKEYMVGILKHPLRVDDPFPVLQYVDDTLLLVQGDTQQINYEIQSKS